ncbi:MAG: hypothetical protein ACI9Z3_001010 [Roseivirga sp.]|jgi:hypothetical protein
MSNKEQKLILKLIQETQSGEIKWRESTKVPSSINSLEKLINSPYLTNVKDKVIRIFKYEYRFYTDHDEFTTSEAFKLEFTNSDASKSLYSFPNYNQIEDLYTEVQRQVSGVDEFLDKYLGDFENPKDEDDLIF